MSKIGAGQGFSRSNSMALPNRYSRPIPAESISPCLPLQKQNPVDLPPPPSPSEENMSNPIQSNPVPVTGQGQEEKEAATSTTPCNTVPIPYRCQPPEKYNQNSQARLGNPTPIQLQTPILTYPPLVFFFFNLSFLYPHLLTISTLACNRLITEKTPDLKRRRPAPNGIDSQNDENWREEKGKEKSLN